MRAMDQQAINLPDCIRLNAGKRADNPFQFDGRPPKRRVWITPQAEGRIASRRQSPNGCAVATKTSQRIRNDRGMSCSWPADSKDRMAGGKTKAMHFSNGIGPTWIALLERTNSRAGSAPPLIF
ncbi:hypothetical protein [Ralstonia pseudosolanacearum]|uniref:hypothetical protein n=1 Tax=Ralstonia pseudosolanacearum TaxID=1310165 RepID=UPI001868B627|nr:hypothetical protein [Ralstonia pseudosolanacearum]QOK94207.1 hypothetical protein HF908_22590 [Ralstonia pseudosolanacearum]UWD87965.1 hypothetical protein NY025_04260 [Ralstonia pseudosolanacearum]